MIATLETTVARHPQVVEQLLPKEAVLLLPSKGEVKVLNDIGARIWMLLDGRRTVREIAAMICAEYAVEPPQAEHDALVFMSDLAKRDLVVVVS